jgi:hypothetical protein
LFEEPGRMRSIMHEDVLAGRADFADRPASHADRA